MASFLLAFRSITNYTSTSRNVIRARNAFYSTENSTIDAKELSHFKKLEQSWWNETGPMKPLHSMNSLRIPFIREGLKNISKLDSEFADTSTPLKNLFIADVGCGGGILTEPLARLGATIVGVDPCKDLVDTAKLHAVSSGFTEENLTYILGTVEEISDKLKNQFDAVVASECVEHVNSRDLFLTSCVNLVKPGGSIFITTLNKTTLSWLLGICAAEYVLNIVPKGTHDWNKFVAPYKIQKTLEDNNCRIRSVHGFTYNFLNNKWYWIPNTSVNYAMHAVKNDTK